jgi:hypothetical protein
MSRTRALGAFVTVTTTVSNSKPGS